MSDLNSALETLNQSQKNWLEVDELSFDNLHIGSFSTILCQKFEKLINLEHLSLNNCGLDTLDSFPFLSNLVMLNLGKNYFPAPSLINLEKLPSLQALILAGNVIDDFKDIEPLTKIPYLFLLDFESCKITNQKGYRAVIFNKFPNLGILDGKDRDGVNVKYDFLGCDEYNYEEYDEEDDEEEHSNSISCEENEETFEEDNELEEGLKEEQREEPKDDRKDEKKNERKNQKKPEKKMDKREKIELNEEEKEKTKQKNELEGASKKRKKIKKN